MNFKPFFIVVVLAAQMLISNVAAQELDTSMLSLDRIYTTGEFRTQRAPSIQWIENGDAYIIIEPSESIKGSMDLVHYDSKSQQRSIFIDAKNLIPAGATAPIVIESYSLSPDGSKVLLFTNSKRVWRSNTKGDYYVFDLKNNRLSKLGKSLRSSSLMFAKFSSNNEFVSYVYEFNVYVENFNTGEIRAITTDGDGDIINGTFDWVYEEEFGCRDGFRWSPNDENIAFWQLDASETGTFFMINNTDSIYSKIVPVQYPKVGQSPSACRVGVANILSNKIMWIPLPGDIKNNYIPSMQWVDENIILLQQLNRKQNILTIWKYDVSNNTLDKLYTEVEKTWVDLSYPDVTSNQWGENQLLLIDDNTSFLRLTETDGWRHIYKIDIQTGNKILLTPGNYDVASLYGVSKKNVLFSASPTNSTQRYLYSVDKMGKGDSIRLTPQEFSGINNYQISDNGKFAVHSHSSAMQINTVRFIALPNHKTIRTVVDNKAYMSRLATLDLPEVRFFTVRTEDGIDVDGRMILPVDFDSTSTYPVLFHVYGEPWGQVGTDNFVGLWNIMLAQKGLIVIDMDNRGTPCLKGSAWRKCIYRQIGVINSRDQAMAAKEVLKWSFVDADRTAVWGWSGGGSMTLNLMFRYPEIYKTGIAVAAVSNQLVYDNIYQERYMGLPQENFDDFMEGSPITYAGNLQGNLLLIHGTADDNVHYQSAELLINELIKQNKQFQMMSYPNRSHGIYEGRNTRRHLYTLITNYLFEHTVN